MKNKLSRISARDSSKDFYNFVFGVQEPPKVNIRGVNCSIKLNINGKRRSKYVNSCYVSVEAHGFCSYRSESIDIKKIRYEEDLLEAINEAIEQVVIQASNDLGPKKEEAFNIQKQKVDKLTKVVEGINAVIHRIKTNNDERFVVKDEELAAFHAVETQIQQLANANEFDDLAENVQIPNIDPDDIKMVVYTTKGAFNISGVDRGNKMYRLMWNYRLDAQCDSVTELEEAMGAFHTVLKFIA